MSLLAPTEPAFRVRRSSRARPRTGYALRNWIFAGAIAMALLVLAQTQVGCVVVVGDSMLPALKSGDLLLVHKRAYRQREPKRGDIVVARFRTELVIKRVIGLPGERVEVANGTVCIDGRAVPERYPIVPGPLDILPGNLAEDRYAILGDNRSGAEYILFYAVMPRERLVGRVAMALRLRWGEWAAWRTAPPIST